MHTFFHGWRRKAGVVTLVIACGLMLAWMRSQMFADLLQVKIPHDSAWHIVGASRGSMLWLRLPDESGAFQIFWHVSKVHDPQKDDVLAFEEHKWVIPYWCPMLPTALLSAYLILWKPRKRLSPD